MKNKITEMTENVAAFGCLASACVLSIIVLVGLFLLLRYLMGLI